MIEEQEHEVQIRKAELGLSREFYGRLAGMVKGIRGVPARIRQIAGNTLGRPVGEETRVMKLAEG